MLSDEEAQAIEESCRSGGVQTSMLMRWVNALLVDRRERVQQSRYIRQRLQQAFQYLAKLFEEKRPTESERDAKARARRIRNM
jgi:hypothetical protein